MVLERVSALGIFFIKKQIFNYKKMQKNVKEKMKIAYNQMFKNSMWM